MLPPLERHSPPPSMHSSYADQYTTPAHSSRLPGSRTSGQVHPLCLDISPVTKPSSSTERLADATVPNPSGHGSTGPLPLQTTPHSVSAWAPAAAHRLPMPYPVASPYAPQSITPIPQVYLSYPHSTPATQVPGPRFQAPLAASITSQPAVTGQTPHVHFSETTFHTALSPGHSESLPPPTAHGCVPNTTVHSPHVVSEHAAVDVHPDPTTLPGVYTYPHVPQSPSPLRAIASQRPPGSAYGGFMQTHQVKNVPVFTGNPDCKILVEDWVRDMQYLLEAIELPMHLRFSTVVRHLGGEARKLILNLPGHTQTPEKAFEELRAEYGDTRGSLDPLADFYERSQNTGESACSYAIALESKLRAVEEKQRGGKPFPDRDSKLTRQFMRGLTDEEVYVRIAPMTPRLLSFRELQTELRNLARETKKFQPHNKAKKTVTQVHVLSEGSGNVKAEKTHHTSELSELTEMVKRLALSQEEHMAKLSRLELRIASPPPASLPAVQPAQVRAVPRTNFTCYRCGKPGHTARICRAVLPALSPAGTPQPTAPAEGPTPQSAQPLNG